MKFSLLSKTPHILLYSDKVVKWMGGEDSQGVANMLFVCIAEEYEHIEHSQLLEHELIHVRQFWRLFLLSSVLVSLGWLLLLVMEPIFVYVIMMILYSIAVLSKNILILLSKKAVLMFEQEAFQSDVRLGWRTFDEAIGQLSSELYNLDIEKKEIEARLKHFL